MSDRVPAKTFKPGDVWKTLKGAKLDPKGRESSHFVVWYEEERKDPVDGPPARYTQDEQVSKNVGIRSKSRQAGQGISTHTFLVPLVTHRSDIHGET